MMRIPAVLWLFVKCCSCQLPCVNDVFADSDFSISVQEHIQEQSENCVVISYNLTVPAFKPFFPYERVWFEGDPSNVKNIEKVLTIEFKPRNYYKIPGLPPGEYEYGLSLKWGCNQTYIFPNRVKISVTELTWKPNLRVSPSIAGNPTMIFCSAPHLCSGGANIKLLWTKSGKQPTEIGQAIPFYLRRRNEGQIFPTAEDHNSTITCVAEYRNTAISRTARLDVQFPPQIQRGSECRVGGKLVVCVCISRGNPPPFVSWPFHIVTDYSVTSYSSGHTVHNTLTLNTDNYPNITMTCISTNNLGADQREIRLQNSTDSLATTGSLACKQSCQAGNLWLAAASFSLNVVLIAALVVSIYKQRRSEERKRSETSDVYSSLRKADVEQEYSVISPQPR